MTEERYIAALEISSSKIIGIVGKTNGSGRLDVIAIEEEKGIECVRYGIVQNLEETYLRAQRVLERLEKRPSVAPHKITGVFTGLSGRSVRSISTEVTMQLADDTEITDAILENLEKQALATGIDISLEIIDAIPRKFIVGKNVTLSPKGAIGDKITGVYDLIVCRPEIRRNLERVITGKLGLDLKGIVVTAMACGHLILSDEEKRQGCMLVDMGAETTTVTIYKDGHIQYFATLPLGGRNITRDIISLSLLEEKAEEIKVKTGDAFTKSESTLNLNGVRSSDVSNVIIARAEEIVINIIQQIHYADLKEKDLHGGIICIGGGAMMKGMLQLLKTKSGLPTRLGTLPSYVLADHGKASDLQSIEAISILYTGATKSDVQCLEAPVRQELPVNGDGYDDEPDEKQDEEVIKSPSHGGGWFRKKMNELNDKLANAFRTPEDDDSDELV